MVTPDRYPLPLRHRCDTAAIGMSDWARKNLCALCGDNLHPPQPAALIANAPFGNYAAIHHQDQ